MVVDRKRKTNASETLPGTRGRSFVIAILYSEESLGNQEKRCRVCDLHLACVAEKEVVEEHAQWRNPDLDARWTATRAPGRGWMRAGAKRVDSAISAWVAEEFNRALGQELTGEGESCMGSGERSKGKGTQLLEEIQGIPAITGARTVRVCC